MNKFVKMLAASLLCGGACNAQITAGLEGGAGRNRYNTSIHLPANGTISKKPVENISVSASLFTTRKGRVNYGGQLSFIHRDFGTYSFGDLNSGSGSYQYNQSYVYITPTVDIALDRRKYLHVQGMLPVGLLVGGNEKRISDRETDNPRKRINYRLGLSCYGQLPITKTVSITAKTEYTASLNKSTYFIDNGEVTRASDLLLKIGVKVILN